MNNTSKLCSVYIDNLVMTDERIIDKYQKFISRQLYNRGKVIGFQNARKEINKKYGKFWRERLEAKKLYKDSIADTMSYF